MDKKLCECCGVRDADEKIDGYALRYFRGEGLKGAWFSAQCCVGGDEAIRSMNDRIRARREQLAVGPATAADGPKFYGTQPEVLPETLPAGTRAFDMRAVKQLVLTEKWNNRPAYAVAGAEYPWAWAEQIDWSTVPIQGAEPIEPPTERSAKEALDRLMAKKVPPGRIEIVAKCRGCSSSAVGSTWCAYCIDRVGEDENVDKVSRAKMDERPEGVAAHARMLAADKKDRPRSTATSRELAKGHPSTWPSQDGEP